jgi:hypothetical protein
VIEEAASLDEYEETSLGKKSKLNKTITED